MTPQKTPTRRSPDARDGRSRDERLAALLKIARPQGGKAQDAG